MKMPSDRQAQMAVGTLVDEGMDAEPKEALMEKLGRFGHHPDPAIDYCVEVEEIEGMTQNVAIGFDKPDEVVARLPLALDFRVGGDAGAVAARGILLRCATRISSLTGIPV